MARAFHMDVADREQRLTRSRGWRGAVARWSAAALLSRWRRLAAHDRVGDDRIAQTTEPPHDCSATRAIVPARTCFHGLTRLSAQPSAVSLCAERVIHLSQVEHPRLLWPAHGARVVGDH